jgi:hypothetical protein
VRGSIKIRSPLKLISFAPNANIRRHSLTAFLSKTVDVLFAGAVPPRLKTVLFALGKSSLGPLLNSQFMRRKKGIGVRSNQSILAKSIPAKSILAKSIPANQPKEIIGPRPIERISPKGATKCKAGILCSLVGKNSFLLAWALMAVRPKKPQVRSNLILLAI